VADRFARIPFRAAGHRELSGVDFRVLTAVASYADANGFAYPRLKRIANDAATDPANASRSIRKLQAAGLLLAHRLKNEKGGYRVHYEVILSAPQLVLADNSQLVLADNSQLVPADNSQRRRTDQSPNIPINRPSRARARSQVHDQKDGLLACGAIAPLPAVVTAEEKARRREIWQQRILNYAQDSMKPEAFRAWCTEFIEHNNNPRHWSVKKANLLSAEMKARKLRSDPDEAVA
jgi:DNA-binding MarR family transcriptional regulator